MAAATSSRTTSRLNLKNRNQQVADPDTIYYLRSKTPHLNDISIAGPFYPLEAIIPHVRYTLRAKSPATLATFDEIVSDAGVQSFVHINAPLAGGNTLTIELVKEENAEVAATLPGQCWLICVFEPLDVNDLGEEGSPKVKSLEISGAFTSVEAANRAAEELLQEKASETPNAMPMPMMQPSGCFAGLVTNGRENILLEVRHETGQIVA